MVKSIPQGSPERDIYSPEVHHQNAYDKSKRARNRQQENDRGNRPPGEPGIDHIHYFFSESIFIDYSRHAYSLFPPDLLFSGLSFFAAGFFTGPGRKAFFYFLCSGNFHSSSPRLCGTNCV